MAKANDDGYGNGIIVLGKRIPLGDKGVRVFTFADYDNWSFEGAAYAKYNRSGGAGTYYRKDKKGKIRLKWDEENLARLREKVSMVLLHTDLTPDSKTCFRVLAQRGLSTHFMINWDGAIFQGCDVGKTAIHGGKVNSRSIGIDLNSLMKNLRNKKWRPPSKNMYRDTSLMWDGKTTYGELTSQQKREYNRRIFPIRKPYMRLENGARVRAFGYTDAQYRALVALLKLFTEELKLFKVEMPWMPGMSINKGLVPEKDGWNGILGHWHVSTQRWDPGPGFQWERVWAMLRNQGNSFPITLADGETMNSLQEPLKVENRASQYYALNEKGPMALPAKLRGTPPNSANYGWFPMGPNQTWNGGILLQAPKGADVRVMTSGTVVAARMNPKNTRWGSANFVLVQHSVPIPRAPKAITTRRKKKKKKVVDEDFVFWTLYMHLDYIDIEKTPKKKLPSWMQALLETEKKDKKKKKKKKKSGDDDLSDLADDGSASLTVPTRVGAGLAALKKGFIATLDEQEIGVAAGKIIGKVGQFGVPTDQDESPSDYLRSQVRVSVFADDRWTRAVDMSVHGKYFLLRSQPSLSDRSLVVKNQDIVQAFAAASFSDELPPNPLSKDKILSASSIQDVYQNTEAKDLQERLHMVVSHHVSEWSDQVDWWRSLTENQDWALELNDVKKMMNRGGFFKRAYQDVVPFVWLNQKVAEKVGIEGQGKKGWSGYLWHFHPIYFLLWLTYKAAPGEKIVFSRKLSKKELRARRKAEKQYMKENKAKGEGRERGFDDCEAGSEAGGAAGNDCVYESLDFVVDDSVDVRSILDEWFEMGADQDDWVYEQAESDD